ncbi:MAG: hypothetical protein ABEH56_02040 [Salinirussus sp.]
MPPSSRRLLAYIVRRHDESGEPVGVGELEAEFGTSRAVLEPKLDRLTECELARATGGCLEPTVTGRELLELPIDGDFLIVDTTPSSRSPSSAEDESA